ISVRSKHHIRQSKALSFVSVNKGAVVSQRLQQSRCFLKQIVVIAILWSENGGLQQSPVSDTWESAEFLDEQAVGFNGFSHSRVNANWHLLSQKLEEFAVLLDGLTNVGHDFRANGVLCWSHVLDVVFGSPLQYIGGRLTVVLRQFGQSIVKPGAHIQADFSGCHTFSLSESIITLNILPSRTI